MKKNYSEPEIVLVLLTAEDVLSTSVETDNDGEWD